MIQVVIVFALNMNGTDNQRERQYMFLEFQ